MSSTLWPLIQARREALAEALRGHLAPVALACARDWGQPEALDAQLAAILPGIPGCHLLYALDKQGRQVTGNVGMHGIDRAARGQDLSGRPFLDYVAPFGEISVSPVYMSQVTRRSCVTAIYRVHHDTARVLGYLAADFDLGGLPLADEPLHAPLSWRQVKGDPAIRAGVFAQTRVESDMDRHIDDVHDIVGELLSRRGVFHAELYYAASRATLWLEDDPRRYRVHVLDEIIDPAACLAYPTRPYPADALVATDRIADILSRFRELRLSDQTIYLRSGSLNLVNGVVSLNFSCDGTHYLPAEAFLAQPAGFWVG